MSEVCSKEDVVTYLVITTEKDATFDNTPYPAFKLSKKTLKKKEARTLFHQQAVYLTAVNVGEKNTYLESFLSDVNVFDHFYPDIERFDSKFEICAVFEGTKNAVEKLRSFFSAAATKKPFGLGYGNVGRNSHFNIWVNNGIDRSLAVKKSTVFHMPGFLKYDPVPLTYFCAWGNLYGLFEGQVQENATLLQLNSALEEVKTSKAVASIPGKVLTQDVVVGFDAYEDLGMGMSRSKGLKLTLKIEKRDGVPSLRQSNLFITTTKAKGYGPVFIVDEAIATDLNATLEEFYKRSRPEVPVYGFTDVTTSQDAKPVNTPLGKLFEAQLTFSGQDSARVSKFFDFGVKDIEA